MGSGRLRRSLSLISILEAERERQGRSISDVAREAKISYHSIERYLGGQRQLSQVLTFRAWARALGFELTLKKRNAGLDHKSVCWAAHQVCTLCAKSALRQHDRHKIGGAWLPCKAWPIWKAWTADGKTTSGPKTQSAPKGRDGLLSLEGPVPPPPGVELPG